eukprot:3467647-Pyramimonas_sp.AAC.1
MRGEGIYLQGGPIRRGESTRPSTDEYPPGNPPESTIQRHHASRRGSGGGQEKVRRGSIHHGR